MDELQQNSLQERITSFLRQNILLSALFLGGLICLGIGLILYFAHNNTSASGVEFVSAQDVKGASSSASINSGQQSEKVFVDVSGAVQRPGVYQLELTSRVQDAFLAAGGLSAEADRDYVARFINLAAPLRDGMKIYVPKIGEAPAAVSVGGISSQGSVQSLGGQGLTSINSASQIELEALPGIGPVTAGKIIASRPYNSINELLSKKAVGKSVFEKIKSQISL